MSTFTQYDPATLPCTLTHPNKQFVYQKLVQGRPPGKPITVSTSTLHNAAALGKNPLFSSTKPHLMAIQGGFRSRPSTAETLHWTANFADKRLFHFCGGPLLAQDELQVLEHPALAHMTGLFELNGNKAVLFQNVDRLGI